MKIYKRRCENNSCTGCLVWSEKISSGLVECFSKDIELATRGYKSEKCTVQYKMWHFGELGKLQAIHHSFFANYHSFHRIVYCLTFPCVSVGTGMASWLPAITHMHGKMYGLLFMPIYSFPCSISTFLAVELAL